MNHATSRRMWTWLSVLTVAAIGGPLRAADEKPISAPPAFDVKDADAFAQCVDTSSAKLEKLAGGMKFLEGPVWVGKDDGHLVFSDIPADELKKWSKQDGLTTFRKPSDMVNGNAIDAEGRLIHACHGKRSVLRTEKDGTVTVLADQFEGKKLNSPNDVVIAADGAVYFTDPPYGLPRGQQSETVFNGVYRLDPKTKQVSLLDKTLTRPNGIALSPDGKTLYVAISDGKSPVIKSYPVKPDGSVGEGKDLCRIDKGAPDGIRVDADGRIWSSAGDGVHVFSAEGKLLGKVLVPESPANLAFGGADGKTLFITARTSLYAIAVKATGL